MCKKILGDSDWLDNDLPSFQTDNPFSREVRLHKKILQRRRNIHRCVNSSKLGTRYERKDCMAYDTECYSRVEIGIRYFRASHTAHRRKCRNRHRKQYKSLLNIAIWKLISSNPIFSDFTSLFFYVFFCPPWKRFSMFWKKYRHRSITRHYTRHIERVKAKNKITEEEK